MFDTKDADAIFELVQRMSHMTRSVSDVRLHLSFLDPEGGSQKTTLFLFLLLSVLLQWSKNP